ncbi:Tripartite motif-containing protein 45-like [Oopsacas minuta]|uniref:Tripartite motif-containing protein 45-like n=1 Tax=Oopsacas minuta TaxID=111878 RepID=A0AAV7KIL4_9METZ|nr:Tripartite motif-containing protein 45-like [Oopsacas minuta]
MNSAIDSSACLNCKIISNECKLLNCCHSLCDVCFYNFLSNDTLHCPNCQIHTQLSDLQDNFVLSEVMNALQLEQKFQHGKKCGNCTSFFPSKAMYYCIECKKFYCAYDYTEHQNLLSPPYYHHVVKSNGRTPTPQPVSSTTCRHINKASYYCLGENQAICRYCAKKDHSGHECVAIAQVQIEKVEEINNQLQIILNKVNSINDYVKSLETMSLDLERYEKQTVSEIIDYYDNEIRNIQERQRLELNGFFTEMESRRTSMSNTVHQAKQLKSFLKQTHRFIKSSTSVLSPPTFISKAHFLSTRCEDIINITQDFNFNLRTVIGPFDHDFYRKPEREESIPGSMISLDSSIVNARTWYNSSQSTRNNSQTNQHHLVSPQRNWMRFSQSKAATLL